MSRDLAPFHRPLSDLFSLDNSPHVELTDEQIAFYHREGYLSGIRLLTDQQVAALRAELHNFFQPDHEGRDLWYEYHANESSSPDTVLFHALGAWRIGTAFHDLLWSPAFGRAASQLLDGAVRFWHDQLFCKPPKHGGVVAWHQDYSYWTRTVPVAHLTCWIALDDSDEANGSIEYIPGSHHWDLLPITGLAGDMNAIEQVLSPAQWKAFQTPVKTRQRAGEATFHHPLMIHGSRENFTDRPRRATVINVFRDGVQSASDRPPLAGVPSVPPGQAMSGTFFPLLTDAVGRSVTSETGR